MVEDGEEETAEESALRDRFRFLRERVYAVSRAFVDRVLGGVDDRLAKPESSFATPFLIEVVNLASSLLGSDRATEDEAEKKRSKE